MVASGKPTEPARTAKRQPPVVVPPIPTTKPAVSKPLTPTLATVARIEIGKRPYLRFAFANPYNLSLLVGGLAVAGIAFSPLVALVTLGLEGVWLLNAPDNPILKRKLWDRKLEALRQAQQQQAREDRMAALDDENRQRVDRLVSRQQEIRALAARNPSFTGDLLREELGKTDRLVDAFLEMALTTGRYEQYLQSVDAADLDRRRSRLEWEIANGQESGEPVDLQKKNLAIIMKRLDKVKEITRYLSVARGQLDLIENSFQLIGDQIVTMDSPQQLSGQLDELLDGVESIKQTAAETESELGALTSEELTP